MPDFLEAAERLANKMRDNVKNQDLHTTCVQLFEMADCLIGAVHHQGKTIEKLSEQVQQLQARVIPPAAPETV